MHLNDRVNSPTALRKALVYFVEAVIPALAIIGTLLLIRSAPEDVRRGIPFAGSLVLLCGIMPLTGGIVSFLVNRLAPVNTDRQRATGFGLLSMLVLFLYFAWSIFSRPDQPNDFLAAILGNLLFLFVAATPICTIGFLCVAYFGWLGARHRSPGGPGGTLSLVDSRAESRARRRELGSRAEGVVSSSRQQR
jgi:hypothetical protein